MYTSYTVQTITFEDDKLVMQIDDRISKYSANKIQNVEQGFARDNKISVRINIVGGAPVNLGVFSVVEAVELTQDILTLKLQNTNDNC